jgi:hypothetical protein
MTYYQDKATRLTFNSDNVRFARLDGKYLYVYPPSQIDTVANSTFWSSKLDESIYDQEEIQIALEGLEFDGKSTRRISLTYNLSIKEVIRLLHDNGYWFDKDSELWRIPSPERIDEIETVVDSYETLDFDLTEENLAEEIETTTLADDLVNLVIKAEESEYKAKYKEALKVIQILGNKLSVEQKVANTKIKPRRYATTNPESKYKEATPVLLLSDLHFGQLIKPDQVNGRNKFNSQIALDRLNKVLNGCEAYIEERRQSREVNDMIILLGGDIIEGELGHGTNLDLEVTEQVLFAENALAGVIDRLEDLGLGLTFHCVSGNHDRLPNFKRVPCDNRMLRSWDNIVYNHLARAYKKHTWNIAQGYVAEFDVYNFKCILSHGDVIKFNGGVGGIAPSLLKWHGNQRKTFRFDYSFLGHWHNPLLCESGIVVNGGLPGSSTYTHNLGLVSAPSQVLTFIDQQYGLNSFHTLYC